MTGPLRPRIDSDVLRRRLARLSRCGRMRTYLRRREAAIEDAVLAERLAWGVLTRQEAYAAFGTGPGPHTIIGPL